MTEIGLDNWPRRDRYGFFKGMSWPFWTVTFPVDVTRLRRWTRERGVSFYRAMVYAVTKAMERVEAFHYKDRDGKIVRHDALVPSFTDLRPGSEDFYIVTLEAGDDMEEFCRRARAASEAQDAFITQGPWAEDELVYFTCLPWFPVTALTNERDLVPWDSVPRVSWGKYTTDTAGRDTLLVSLELNHRLLDGVHAGRMFEALTDFLEAL